ncbi:hypothetical protein MTBSS4_140064 [Magnetospirillum sp. SS-4]|nr:hypothetical protein MTBSS4_140064 [Magnetospirillum sp. SS-4]
MFRLARARPFYMLPLPRQRPPPPRLKTHGYQQPRLSVRHHPARWRPDPGRGLFRSRQGANRA